MKNKSLQELTIKDNFMFGAVMLDPENCRAVLERILGIPISHVEVSREKSIVYNPEYKGVRLDAYAKDEQNTHYNVEMQTLPITTIKNRARYYHSQIDMEILLRGEQYKELPETYVIFICDFDPFGLKKYRYTEKKICAEKPDFSLENGSHTIFLSTKGENEDEVPDELVQFLKFVEAPLSECNQDFDDVLIQKLQETIREIKMSREMGARFMAFQDVLEDEKERAREEGRSEGLREGRSEGLREGRSEGLREGRSEGLREGRSEGLREGRSEGIRLVAINLLKNNFPLNQISEMTNLSEEELLALSENES